MNQSIATQFYEDNNFSPSKASPHKITSRLTPIRSKEQLYIDRLQQKIKEMKTMIKQKRPVLEQLKGQRKFFKKICQKQRQKIDGVDINLIKSEYELEVEKLKEERMQLQEMIGLIHDESNNKISEYVEAKEELKQNRKFLMNTLTELKEENETYKTILQDKNGVLEQLQTRKVKLRGQIKSKQVIQKKYVIALEEIRRLQLSRRGKSTRKQLNE